MGSGLHMCWEMSARLLRSLSPWSRWDTLTHLIKLSDKWHCSAQMNLKCCRGRDKEVDPVWLSERIWWWRCNLFFFLLSSLVRLWPNRNLCFVASTWSPNSCLPSPKKQTSELAAHLVCKVHPEFRMGKLWEPWDCGGGGDWRSLELERSSYKPERRKLSSRQCASPLLPVLCDTWWNNASPPLGSTVAPKDVQHSKTIKPSHLPFSKSVGFWRLSAHIQSISVIRLA